MSLTIRTWALSKTSKAIDTTRAELSKIAVKYTRTQNWHPKFIQVTFLGGNNVRLCKTSNPVIRESRHNPNPKAIWALKKLPLIEPRVVSPVQDVEVQAGPLVVQNMPPVDGESDDEDADLYPLRPLVSVHTDLLRVKMDLMVILRHLCVGEGRRFNKEYFVCVREALYALDEIQDEWILEHPDDEEVF